MRLHRFIALCGVSSRRRAESFIVDGRVQVNGRTVRELGFSIDPDNDSVTVDGKGIVAQQPVLIAFHKPRGMVSTLSDPEERPCIGDVVRGLPYRIYPVGRLDIDVGGLILLSNDGERAHKMLHPSFGATRTYIARVKGVISSDVEAKLVKGCRLEDGFAKAVSATQLTRESAEQRFYFWKELKGKFIELVVAEGRYHFVKRLLSAVGLEVVELYRTTFGPYKLGSLRPGVMKQVKFADADKAAALAISTMTPRKPRRRKRVLRALFKPNLRRPATAQDDAAQKSRSEQSKKSSTKRSVSNSNSAPDSGRSNERSGSVEPRRFKSFDRNAGVKSAQGSRSRGKTVGAGAAGRRSSAPGAQEKNRGAIRGSIKDPARGSASASNSQVSSKTKPARGSRRDGTAVTGRGVTDHAASGRRPKDKPQAGPRSGRQSGTSKGAARSHAGARSEAGARNEAGARSPMRKNSSSRKQNGSRPGKPYRNSKKR